MCSLKMRIDLSNVACNLPIACKSYSPEKSLKLYKGSVLLTILNQNTDTFQLLSDFLNLQHNNTK